jgi:hypothetical protein
MEIIMKKDEKRICAKYLYTLPYSHGQASTTQDSPPFQGPESPRKETRN